MRKVAIVIVSALVALMFVRPASAAPGLVSFTDRTGDLGHPVYTTDTDPMEPSSYWPATSPVGMAGYLDMLGGWMSVDEDGVITVGLTVLSGLTDESTLPGGVKAVWWTWFLCKDTGYFFADYAVHFCWDGTVFEGVVLVRGQEDPAGEVRSWSISGNQIIVAFDEGLVLDAAFWFAESICWIHTSPHTDLGYLPSGGWFAADITDGPFLPWLPVPV